jgi:HK97 family phage prohead protease
MTAKVETRAASVASEGQTIRGLAIPFGSLSEDLGGYREVFEPSAVDRTLREQLDVRAFTDHAMTTRTILGRVRAGTLRLLKRDDGLHVEIDVPDTTIGRDTLTSVERGDVTGMSIAFMLMPGGERFERRDGGPVRIVSDSRIVEVSLVPFPAYAATDASVAQRALAAYRATQGQSVTWLRLRHHARG